MILILRHFNEHMRIEKRISNGERNGFFRCNLNFEGISSQTLTGIHSLTRHLLFAGLLVK